MDSATAASRFLGASEVSLTVAETRMTTTTASTAGILLTAPMIRTDERRRQETSLFFDKLMLEVLGEIGRKRRNLRQWAPR